jgi:SAM-dependent methyltransferase
MLVSDMKGNKVPDEYVVRFFFKEGLDKKTGRVLELGCGNGVNLSLFYQYGWDVVGVDLSEEEISAAQINLSKIRTHYDLQNDFRVYCEDMGSLAGKEVGVDYDVIILPNSICYLPFDGIEALFDRLKTLLGKNAMIFIRTRTPQDYRYGRGDRRDDKSFVLNIEETGEKGALCTFLYESDIVKLLEANFTVLQKHIFYCRFDNIQNGSLVCNSDIIVWCNILNDNAC